MLKDLLETIDYELLSGSLDLDIHDICYDTNHMCQNSLFVCLKGKTANGHFYIDEAISKGAIAIVVSEDVKMRQGITYIKVKHTRIALAHISDAFFHHPRLHMKVIGITGTKGKTTISYMIAAVLRHAHKKVGVIGTNGCMIDEKHIPTKNTTPESYEIHYLMNEMVNQRCEYCLMEVSSQGLMMDRVEGIDFDYGIFTNLSWDHISENEHPTFEDYKNCKNKLFQKCLVAIVNQDDDYVKDMIKDVNCTIYTYSLHKQSHLQAIHLSFYRQSHCLGVYFQTQGLVCEDFELSIPGEFNVYNALATIILCTHLGIGNDKIKEAFKNISIKGRNEIVKVNANYTVMIDYAHNAFSYDCLLKTITQYHPCLIICVYGAGGQRDLKRRYETGRVVASYQAYSIITTDNPRNESVEKICQEITRGIESLSGKYIIIEDRKQAIEYALSIAKDDDIVLCLGKGHEDYQIIHGVKYPFDERKIIEEYFQK